MNYWNLSNVTTIYYLPSKLKILFIKNKNSYSLSRNIKALISYLTQHIYEMTPYKEAYKYPFIASEILSSKNRLIVRTLFDVPKQEEDNNILNLFKVLDNKDILNTTIPGYIHKIISSHIENEKLYDNMITNNNNKNYIFDILLKYIFNDSYRDIFYLITNEVLKRDIKEYNYLINKIFENLLFYMNKYISIMESTEENKENIVEIKDDIFNLIYILVKLGENNHESFSLIIKELSTGNLLNNLKNNLKQIDEDENENQTENKNKFNLNVFYCLNKISILFSNLYNIILVKNENNNKYAYYKYYLSTIIDPPYNPYEYKAKGEVKEIENEKEEDINLLIEISILFLREAFSIFENKIETIDELNKSIIFSFYNKITDIIILIIVIEKKDNEKLNAFLNEILIDLIQLIIDYPYCSILHNKTLKIFQYITEYNLSINKEQLLIFLKNYLNQKIIINDLINEEGTILNNKKESNSNIYLISILNLLEKQEDSKIKDYLEKANQGLLESEKMDPKDYVPKPDEEEIIMQKKQDIHDTEAFIFTPKKVIEDSKKIMKNLKELDV